MAQEFYTVTKEIYGKTYKAQFSGVSTALKATDESYIDGTTNIGNEKLAKYLFNNIIVEPKVSIEDFGKDKVGEKTTKKIAGVEYTAEFKGVATALKAIDESYIDGTNNTSNEKFAEYIFNNIIVKPARLTADDFDNMEDFNDVLKFGREVMQGGDAMKEFNEVVKFAREVMQGNFRDKKDKGTTKEASKG